MKNIEEIKKDVREIVSPKPRFADKRVGKYTKTIICTWETRSTEEIIDDLVGYITKTTFSYDEIKRKAVMGFMQFLVTQRNWDGARIGITRTLAENYLQSLDGGEQHTAPQTTKSEEIEEDVTTIGGLKEEYERKIKILGVQAQKAKKYGGNVASIEGQIQGIKWALSKVYKADLTKYATKHQMSEKITCRVFDNIEYHIFENDFKCKCGLKYNPIKFR